MCAITRWLFAPAVISLALAFPATALGVQTQGSAASGGSGSAPGGAAGNAVFVVPDTGDSSPHGSTLVQVIQHRLADAGFAPGAIDGHYGPLTERAVLDFQASHGLRVDGIVGPQTWTALNPANLALTVGAGYQPGGSELVRSLQAGLARAGFAPGPIDGRYGPLTEHAVGRFQASHGLPVNGEAGPRMLALVLAPAAAAHASEPGPAAHSPKPAPPHASQRQPRAPGSPPFSAHRSPAQTNAGQPAHGGAALSTGLVVALSLLGMAPILAAAWYWRRRRSGRFAPAPPPVVDPNESAALAHPRSVVASVEPEPADATTVPGAFVDGDGSVAVEHSGNGHAELGNGHAELGNGHAELGNGHGQSAAVEEVVRHADQRDEAGSAFDLGLLLEEQGDLAGAQAAYRRADQRSHAAAASNLGVLFEEQGALAEAEAAYRRADERGDATGAFNLGVLLEEQGALSEAEAAYSRADQRGHAAAASNLGVLLEEQGASAEAEEAYRRADERGDATGAFNLGVMLEEQGAVVDAERAYQRADQRGNAEVSKIARAALLELHEGMQDSTEPRAAAGHHDG